MKYVRVMDELKSNAGGFEYKLDEVDIASLLTLKKRNQKSKTINMEKQIRNS